MLKFRTQVTGIVLCILTMAGCTPRHPVVQERPEQVMLTVDLAPLMENSGSFEGTALADGARFVPSVQDAKPNGFRIHRIRPDSIFAKAGLREGDLIKSVNGLDISTPDHALAAYTKLKSESRLSVLLERPGTHAQ